MLFANSKGHMKAFDEDQKKYITKMIENCKNCQSAFPKDDLYSIFVKHRIFFDDTNEKESYIFFYCEENEFALKEVEKIYKGLEKTALLFRVLKDNQYIYLINSGNNKQIYPIPDNSIINCYKNEGLIRVDRKVNEYLAEFFRDCFNNSVGITPKLINLSNKDFKTIEDLFVEEQRNRTKWTVVGTLVKVFSAILKFLG